MTTRRLVVIIPLAIAAAALAAAVVLSILPRPYHRPAWADVDGDCQDTRAEVLISRCQRIELDSRGCRVVSATCADAYSGRWITTSNPGAIFHVDHVLPSAEMWKRRNWTAHQFAQAFNDQDGLELTTRATNLRKSDRMPDQWCPALVEERPRAASRVRTMALRYELHLSPEEQAALAVWDRGECAPGARVLGGVR
jgi:hypothetical protein